MRRFLSVLCVLMVLWSIPCLALTEGEPPTIPAKAFLLMDATTGQTLYERNSRLQLPMASTTKIMTAILAIERGNLTDVVTSGEKPYNTGGTTMYLELGEQQTIENLLYALLLESANDAAVAIAEHLAGSEEVFAQWMNDKAKEIGATQTHFVNSHGLHDKNHYTTAYDLALIARYAMQNQKFREFVATEEKVIAGAGKNPPRHLITHDQLLGGTYPDATGVKNGFTEEAGLTNVASAKRGNTEFLAVVLGANDRLWTSSMALLDYGFSHFRTLAVVRKGDLVGPVTVIGGSPAAGVAAANLSVTVPVNETAVEREITQVTTLRAPLETGASVGRLEALQDGKVLGAVDLVSAVAVQPLKPVGAEASFSAFRSERTRPRAIWVAALVGVLGTAFMVFRRRHRHKRIYIRGRATGREGLYEIRNRRRL